MQKEDIPVRYRFGGLTFKDTERGVAKALIRTIRSRRLLLAGEKTPYKVLGRRSSKREALRWLDEQIQE